MEKIITHPGKAHLDDLLSTCIVIYKSGNIKEIERREPTAEEIQDVNIWKLDIGDDFNPKKKIYDHHQKEMEDCTLSLLLKDWNMWEKAIKVHAWLETTVMLDASGLKRVIESLDISQSVFLRLQSFISSCVLSLFQQKIVIKNTDPLFSLLYFVGKSFLEQIKEYYDTLTIVEENLEFREIKGVPVIQCLNIEKIPSSLSHILSQKKRDKWGQGGIAIFPNDRPIGSIAVKRYDDDERVDFRKIADFEKVIFAHKNGFFVALKQMSNFELKRYIESAIKEN